jgi:hypothetical protein
METQVKKKLERIKIIYNGDMEISDFLSDLEDRSIVYDLTEFLRDAKGLPGCLLRLSRSDDMVVLILYKSPFAFNEPDNTLMLYASNNLHELMVYFKNLLENTSKEKSVINQALTDIVQLLYREWVIIQEDNTPLNFMG